MIGLMVNKAYSRFLEMLAESGLETRVVRIRKNAARELGQYTGSHLVSARYRDDGDRADVINLLCTGYVFPSHHPGSDVPALAYFFQTCSRYTGPLL